MVRTQCLLERVHVPLSHRPHVPVDGNHRAISFRSFDEPIMFALHGQHRDSLDEVSVCIPRVTQERPCTMSEMNHPSENYDSASEIERLSIIEKEIRLMRNRTIDIVQSAYNLGDYATVATLDRLSDAMDQSASMIHAHIFSLRFGDD